MHYQSDEIRKYYAANRLMWEQFYPSERAAISGLGLTADTRVLDLGCGCGGLGLALRERFGISDYTGVEINAEAAAVAAKMNPQAHFLAADILNIAPHALREADFDLVVSLSCIDWNVEFDRMLHKAWSYVRPGGHFLASFRLVEGPGVADMEKSFQYINFQGIPEGEVAPYVVLGAADLHTRLVSLDPAGIQGCGYWGAPSATARTPFREVCFAVIALEKRLGANQAMYCSLDLPENIHSAFVSSKGIP